MGMKYLIFTIFLLFLTFSAYADYKVTGNLTVTQNVTARYYYGSGLYLTDISGGTIDYSKVYYKNETFNQTEIALNFSTTKTTTDTNIGNNYTALKAYCDVNDTAQYLLLQTINNTLFDRYNATKEPTGFPEQGVFSSTLSFNDTTRNFSICGTYDHLS